jgi:hypothetical protein
MKTVNSGGGLTVRAHKGDASRSHSTWPVKTQNFTGFTIRITAARLPYYMTNLLRYSSAVLTKNKIKAARYQQYAFSPIQKYRWVHVPATFHQIDKAFYGTYTYDVTRVPRSSDILQPLTRLSRLLFPSM